MEASLIRFLPASHLRVEYLWEATRSVPSTLPAQPPLSLRRSHLSAFDVFEECPPRPRVAPGVRRGRILQVCRTGQLAWLCLRPWKLSPFPFRTVLLRSSRLPSSYPHQQFQALLPVWTRIRD